MSLDDDTRHSGKNREALERSAEQLRPSVRLAMMRELELDEDEFQAFRDMSKAGLRARKRREEQKNASIMEVIKWALGLVLGGLGTWLVTNWHNTPPGPGH